MSSNDSTINLDDSSVMSSTKNSSVLEMSGNDSSVVEITNNSVIDVSSDSSDTEEADTVNSTSENIDSSSDRLQREHSRDLTDDDLAAISRENTEDDLANSEHYVTSMQTINNGESLLSPDQSSILSASQLVSDFDISSNQATKDESSLLGALNKELSEHQMKLSESVVEGLGENAVNNNDTIDELSNDLAKKIKIMNDLKESTSNNTSAIDNSNVDKSIEETFRDKSIAKSFGAEEDEDEPGSPHKRKVENGVVEDTMTMSSSSFQELPSKRPKTESPELPSTCQMLVSATTGAKVYLVGTAHFSKESCEDVKRVIENVQPDIVVIELCKARTNLLQLDDATILEEAQNLSLDKSLEIIRQQGTVQGVMYLLLLSMSAHLTKELGMAPGGEFRTAFQEANKVSGCIVQLGDRPINITLKRAIASLSWWQTLRLGWNILTNKDPITKEDVENCKNKDLLQNMLAEMAGEFPALSSVFVDERDIFLCHSLQMASEAIPAHALTAAGHKIDSYTPPTVVGVVGIGHMPGIMAKWGSVTHDQVRAVVKVSPPSVVSRVASLTVKTLLWGGCLYGAYRLVRGPTSRLLLAR